MSDQPEPYIPEHIEDTVYTNDRLHISLRGIITAAVIVTICAMSVYGLEVKEPLYTIASMAIGWYFGRVPQKKLT